MCIIWTNIYTEKNDLIISTRCTSIEYILIKLNKISNYHDRIYDNYHDIS